MKKYTANKILTQNGLQSNIAVVLDENNHFTKYEHVDHETITMKGILTPGWVNSHAHIEFSHLAGKIQAHQGMANFIQQIQSLRNNHFEAAAQKILHSIEAEGCVLWVDTTNNPAYQDYSQQFQTTMSFLTFFECLGLSETRANNFIEHFNKLKCLYPELKMTFHSPYSCGDYVINEVLKQSSLLSVHVSESLEEIELLQTNKGALADLFSSWSMELNIKNRYPFRKQFWRQAEKLYQNPKVIWVHNTESENIKLMGDEWFCLCPGANLFLHNRLPNSKNFEKVLNRILLGTDSAAGNEQISLTYELEMLQKASFSLEMGLMALTWNASECWNCTKAGFYPGKETQLVLYNPMENHAQKIT